jgi:hypothetical protein
MFIVAGFMSNDEPFMKLNKDRHQNIVTGSAAYFKPGLDARVTSKPTCEQFSEVIS